MKKSFRLTALLLALFLLSACAGPEPNALPAAEKSEVGLPIAEEETEPLSIPLMSVGEAEELYSLEGCFSSLGLLWEGRRYTPYGAGDPILVNALPDTALLDEYLGDTVWPPKGTKSEILNLPASTAGPCYSVRGYDPSFLLCQRNDSGRSSWYLSLSGRSLRRGAELLEELMHCSEVLSIRWQTGELWPSGSLKGRELKDELLPEAKGLLNELGDCPFVSQEAVTEELGVERANELSRFQRLKLYLTMPGGMIFLLQLYEGGYLSLTIDYEEKLWLRGGEAGKGLLELLRYANGTEIAWEERQPLRYEDLLLDPCLGAFLPTELPEGLSFRQGGISYEIERETGALGPAHSLLVDFQDVENTKRSFSLQVYSASAFMSAGNYAGDVLSPEELNEETVEAHTIRVNSHGRVLENPSTNLGLRSGDMILVMYATGLETEETLSLLRSALSVNLP